MQTRVGFEEQIKEVVRLVSPRHGFTNSAITAELQYDQLGEYTIRLVTFLFDRPFHTTIRLTSRMLDDSASGNAPMIIQYIEEGLESLRNTILNDCGQVTRGHPIRRGHDEWSYGLRYGDSAPVTFPRTPDRNAPIQSKRGGKIDKITITMGEK